MLPQTKINGMAIAWARAQWGELEDGGSGYIIPDENSYKITITAQTMALYDITEDDLMTCIDVIEKQIGDNDEYRLRTGLMGNTGYQSTGVVVKHPTKPLLKCVFTPASDELGMVDAFFEWYFDSEAINNGKNISDVLGFANVVKPETSLEHIEIPSYEEASVFSLDKKCLSESQRDMFLETVWSYHKNLAQGYKDRVEIRAIWKQVLAEK
jgi:hypothetical protein